MFIEKNASNKTKVTEAINSLLDEMSGYPSDSPEYAKMVEDDDVRDVFNIILDEWQLTKNVILQIENQEDLLAELPSLKASLDYRLPYFNVLNYIQIELINRLRKGELSADQESLIHITINGIATGLRNSG